MNQHPDPNKELHYRLIALWVVCEAFAGGIMHGAKIPFTGMIVSSLAVTCIILIAYYIPDKKSILQATIIVAGFKLALSPHSPPTAYIAVFFQGLIGQLLFSQKRFFTAAAIVLAVLSLVESAVQRILVLLVLYGNTFWDAVDQYIQKVVGGNDRDYSLLMASAYILLHAIMGVFTGTFAARLAKRSAKWQGAHPSLILEELHPLPLAPARKKKKMKRLFIIVWLVLLFLFIQSYIDPENAVLPASSVFRILLRSLLILLSWYLLVAPLLMRALKKALAEQQKKQPAAAAAILQLLPQTRHIFIQSWSLSESERGFKRLKLFLKILVMNILSDRQKIN